MMSRQIKTIGIVGGLGPESTIEYYRQIIARYREQISDGSYPKQIVKANRQLLEKDFPHTYYSRQLLFRDRPRESWVELDLKHFLKDVF